MFKCYNIQTKPRNMNRECTYNYNENCLQLTKNCLKADQAKLQNCLQLVLRDLLKVLLSNLNIQNIRRQKELHTLVMKICITGDIKRLNEFYLKRVQNQSSHDRKCKIYSKEIELLHLNNKRD